jgi:hypothetical protein
MYICECVRAEKAAVKIKYNMQDANFICILHIIFDLHKQFMRVFIQCARSHTPTHLPTTHRHNQREREAKRQRQT